MDISWYFLFPGIALECLSQRAIAVVLEVARMFEVWPLSYRHRTVADGGRSQRIGVESSDRPHIVNILSMPRDYACYMPHAITIELL